MCCFCFVSAVHAINVQMKRSCSAQTHTHTNTMAQQQLQRNRWQLQKNCCDSTLNMKLNRFFFRAWLDSAALHCKAVVRAVFARTFRREN